MPYVQFIPRVFGAWEHSCAQASGSFVRGWEICSNFGRHIIFEMDFLRNLKGFAAFGGAGTGIHVLVDRTISDLGDGNKNRQRSGIRNVSHNETSRLAWLRFGWVNVVKRNKYDWTENQKKREYPHFISDFKKQLLSYFSVIRLWHHLLELHCKINMLLIKRWFG